MTQVVLVRNVSPHTLSSILVEGIPVVGIYHPLALSDVLHLDPHHITQLLVRVQTLPHGTTGAHLPLQTLVPLGLAHLLFW